MGAKYGETRLATPTAEVVCLGLAAVLGGAKSLLRLCRQSMRFIEFIVGLLELVDEPDASSDTPAPYKLNARLQ